MSTRVVEWPDAPSMDVGSPLPSVLHSENYLIVAYRCSNPEFPGWDSGADIDHPGFDVWSAVVRFSGVTWYPFGGPSEHMLESHPLFTAGLGYYRFWEVLHSSRVPAGSTLRHWIATFHDETLEVVAASADVVSRRVEGEDTQAIALGFTGM